MDSSVHFASFVQRDPKPRKGHLVFTAPSPSDPGGASKCCVPHSDPISWFHWVTLFWALSSVCGLRCQ